MDNFYDTNYFLETISNFGLVAGNTHTIYIKIRYDTASFAMVGNQFGFTYNSDGDFKMLQDNVISKLNVVLSEYGLTNENLEYIQLSFRVLDKNIYSDLFVDKSKVNFLSASNRKTLSKNIKIPEILERDKLGKPLGLKVDNDNFITSIELTINGITSNFLDQIIEKAKHLKKNHPDNLTRFDKDYEFYYIKSSIDYILVLKNLDRFNVEKFKYSINGVLISKIKDTYENNGSLMVRKIGSNRLYIKNNKVIKSVNSISFKYIESPKLKKK